MVSTVDLNTVAGLSEQEAIALLKHDGYNELPSARSSNLLSIAWDMVQDPIFLLLVGGGVIYWILGDLQEALILLGFVFFITGISLYQEGKTEHALEALRDLSSPRALVIRDKQRKVCDDSCDLWTHARRLAQRISCRHYVGDGNFAE